MAVAAGIGAVGTLLSARESRRATESAVDAARFRPFSVNGPAGQVQVGEDGQVNLIADAERQAFSDALRGTGMMPLRQGLANLQGMALDGNLQMGRGGNVLGNIPLNMQADRGLMNQAMMLDPNALNPMMQQMASARGQAGQIAGMGFGNLQSALGMAGMQGAMGGQFLQQAGSTDINALAADRLSQLNALAQPGEDRMAAQLGDRLFASGRNATTGGAQQFGELMQAQSRADMERRIMATQFATGEQSRLVGLGQGLQAGGQNLALGALSGAGGASGQFAGLIQGEAGLQGARNDIIGQQFQQMLGANQLGMERGLARGNFLLDAQNQRFGQQFANQNMIFDQGLARAELMRGNALAQLGAGEGILGLSQSFDPFNQLMAQGSMSTALSGAAAGAGANMGSFIAQGGADRANMISSMFSGLMSGVQNRGG